MWVDINNMFSNGSVTHTKYKYTSWKFWIAFPVPWEESLMIAKVGRFRGGATEIDRGREAW